MGSTKKPKISKKAIGVAVKKAIRKDAATRKQEVAEQVKIALQIACDNGDMLSEMDRASICRQAACNHRKGGMLRTRPVLYGQDAEKVISERVIFPTQGTASQYAVIKHRIMNGDIWVFCLRCGKKWKPPIRANYTSETQFILACVDYQKAVEFPMNNVMSDSIQVSFKNRAGSEKFRKSLSGS